MSTRQKVGNVRGIQGVPGERGATGAKGETGSQGQRGSQIFYGNKITGTSASSAIFPESNVENAYQGDKYLNTDTDNMYDCVVAGGATQAKWLYIGCIKGSQGIQGEKGEKGDQGVPGTVEHLEECIEASTVMQQTKADIEEVADDLEELDETVTGLGQTVSGLSETVGGHTTSITTLNQNLANNGYGADSGGKNLINPTLATKTTNGVTCTNNGDGTYTLNGTATATTIFYLTDSFSVKAGTYKLCGCASGGSGSTYKLDILNASGSPIAVDGGNGITFTLDSGITSQGIRIVVYQGITISNKVFKPMLTANTSLTYDDFEPYFPSNRQINDSLASMIKEYSTPLKVRFASTANACVIIKDKVQTSSIFPDAAPTTINYIPVVTGHSVSNNVLDHIFYEGGAWKCYSNSSQNVGVYFYKVFGS